jgi:membrane-associated phospholipid phosphatase
MMSVKLFYKWTVGLIAASLIMTGAPSWGQDGPTPSTGASSSSNPLEWPRFLLDTPDQFRLDAPPARKSRTTKRELRELRSLQEVRTGAVRRKVRFWNSDPAIVPWTKTALDMIVLHRPRPPIAARGLALLHGAMYDAYIAAIDTRRSYFRAPPERLDSRIKPLVEASRSSYVPVHAVVAGAAEIVLQHLFPDQKTGTFEALATEAVESRLYAGVNYRSDVRRGRALGRKVANLYLERAEDDGVLGTAPAYPRRTGEEYWVETPPRFEPATGGPVGTWKPWVMSSPGEARTESEIPGPPAYGSAQFMDELDEVLRVQDTLTDAQQQMVIFWDDGPGTFTPAGHWNSIALELLSANPLGEKDTVRLFGLLNAALADGAIAAFEAKYFWWSIRPITAVRRLCNDGARLCTTAELEDDPSLADHPGWLSYIDTPPFPSYPGGHSTFSGAGGRILEEFFPAADGAIDRIANEAAESRLFGGIHFSSDNNDGLILGRTVAQIVLDWSSGLRESPPTG